MTDIKHFQGMVETCSVELNSIPARCTVLSVALWSTLSLCQCYVCHFFHRRPQSAECGSFHDAKCRTGHLKSELR